MGSGILTVAGSTTGETLIGHADMQMSDVRARFVAFAVTRLCCARLSDCTELGAASHG